MPRRVLLIEPDYKNKYPPMGLMKIATYYKQLGDNVRFFKGDLRDLMVALLCEDLIKILKAIKPKVQWVKYKPNLLKFIRYGRISDIPEGKHFTNSDVMDNVEFFRDKFKAKEYFENPRFDVVCITTLFTFHWKITIETINFAKLLCKNASCVFVGGVAATILSNYIEAETGIRPIAGILDKPGVLDKKNKTIIDTLPLDYSILHEIDYRYPVTDAYFTYTTRGCVNTCPFCAVPILEPEYQEYISLHKQLNITKKRFGEQRNLLLLDNNVLASSCFDEIIDEIKKSGFKQGATYLPPNPYAIAIRNLRSGINDRAYINICVELFEELLQKLKRHSLCKETTIYHKVYKKICDVNCDQNYTATKKAILNLNAFIAPIYKKYAYRPFARQRYVDFNQGVDARLITAENMHKLSEVNIRPLRIAFDHWGAKKTYERAVRTAVQAGITHMSNYMLYNFNDKPVELYRRMALTVNLCEELDIAIYSFPMKYHPIDDPAYFKNREFIGKFWCRKYIRAIQAVLTSTHGKIGRGKQFFEAAFGRNEEEFEEILLMPEAFIIKRFEHDEAMRKRYPEKCKKSYKYTLKTTDEWRKKFNRLSLEKRKMAIEIICENKFDDFDICCKDKTISNVLAFYKISRDE
jgi:hypothetical protein